jgi:phage FluMu protein Com
MFPKMNNNIVEIKCPKCSTSIPFYALDEQTLCPVCKSIFALSVELIEDGPDEYEETT